MSVSASQRKLLTVAALAGLVMGALAFINFVHFSRESLLAQDIQNFGHVIVFSILAVAVHTGVRLVRAKNHPGARAYGLSAGILLALGIVSEALQLSTARNADLGDWLRDCVGSYVGLTACAVFAWATRDGGAAQRRFSVRLALASLVGLVLLAVAATPVAMGLAASLKRNTSFPDLLPKSALFVDRYVSADSLRFVDDSKNSPLPPYVRCVLTNRLFPGLILVDPVSDWQNYRYLNLKYRLTGPQTQVFFLLVDLCDEADQEQMYRYELPFEVGQHELTIDLASGTGSPGGWTPIRCVDRLYLKTARVDSSLTLDIYKLYLEP